MHIQSGYARAFVPLFGPYYTHARVCVLQEMDPVLQECSVVWKASAFRRCGCATIRRTAKKEKTNSSLVVSKQTQSPN